MIRLQDNMTSLAAEYARAGKDWEAELRQISRERKLMDELGITPVQLGRGGADNGGDDGRDD